MFLFEGATDLKHKIHMHKYNIIDVVDLHFIIIDIMIEEDEDKKQGLLDGHKNAHNKTSKRAVKSL